MSKWTIDGIKNQIKFGDFVAMEGDIDIDDKVFFKVKGSNFFILTESNGIYEYNKRDLETLKIKFFNRRGKEILPEPEYKYVNFDSFGELCEAIINKEVYDALGNKQCYMYSQVYDLPRFYVKCFKRVEV